jgi:hypothetical protein
MRADQLLADKTRKPELDLGGEPVSRQRLYGKAMEHLALNRHAQAARAPRRPAAPGAPPAAPGSSGEPRLSRVRVRARPSPPKTAGCRRSPRSLAPEPQGRDRHQAHQAELRGPPQRAAPEGRSWRSACRRPSPVGRRAARDELCTAAGWVRRVRGLRRGRARPTAWSRPSEDRQVQHDWALCRERLQQPPDLPKQLLRRRRTTAAQMLQHLPGPFPERHQRRAPSSR